MGLVKASLLCRALEHSHKGFGFHTIRNRTWELKAFVCIKA